ncbi:MAG: pyrroline-5-carboxylate reductase [Proteobacteria bacterium]|nr:pyrroline-5-carboxylate reductase [Pseudomonadota bacterium]MBU1709808.1 pyrroline-5-carboxylate reductase [Pseudomonadota bacterium]
MDRIDAIGFIGGGQMAEAMIKGLLKAGLVKADRIYVGDPSEQRRSVLSDGYNVCVFETSEAVYQESDIVILAVKPQIIVPVLEDSQKKAESRHLIISIVAGIPLAVLEANLAGSGCRVIRVMPNTPAIIQEGASALSPGKRATEEDMDIARVIFDAMGKSVVLDESYMDAVTGLSGSGPAYVFTFIEAMIDAGVRTGLPRDVSEALVEQTVLGSVKLVLESGKHPAELRAMVTSPGGTTIAGMHVLEKAGFRGMIMDAVAAGTHRSRELGQAMVGKNKE